MRIIHEPQIWQSTLLTPFTISPLLLAPFNILPLVPFEPISFLFVYDPSSFFKDLGHFWLGYIRIYPKAGTLGIEWSLSQFCEGFYPGKCYMKTLCKDVGYYSRCSLYDFSIGTLVWKVSQILCILSLGFSHWLHAPFQKATLLHALYMITCAPWPGLSFVCSVLLFLFQDLLLAPLCQIRHPPAPGLVNTIVVYMHILLHV